MQLCNVNKQSCDHLMSANSNILSCIHIIMSRFHALIDQYLFFMGNCNAIIEK